MAWLVLFLAGIFEALWAIALGASDNFRRPGPTVVFLIGVVLSLGGLSYAMMHLPTGTAYAVWVGIGATLTVVWALVTGKEAATLGRIVMLLLLIGCVVGLKAVS